MLGLTVLSIGLLFYQDQIFPLAGLENYLRKVVSVLYMVLLKISQIVLTQDYLQLRFVFLRVITFHGRLRIDLG